LPGLPHGKPAGVPCAQLDEALRCKVFGTPQRPAFFAVLQQQLARAGDVLTVALWTGDAPPV